MILPGTPIDFVNHVVILETGLDKTSGTIYAYVRRSSDGYWWSLAAGGSWVVSKPTGGSVPTATALAHGLWRLTFSALQTSTLQVGDVIVCRMTDNETEATATVTSDVVEHTVSTAPAAAPSAAQVADAVWEEVLTDHLAVSGGAADVLYNAGLDIPNIPGTVWDISTGMFSPGTTGEALEAAAAAPSAAVVADAVWDEAAAGHVAVGSTGEALQNANNSGSIPSAATIADAVWDEDMTAHNIPDTAGAMLTSMGAVAGIGSELLTVTILDPNLNPLQAAAVYCHNVSGALVAHSMTNASGVAILAPGAGVNTITVYYTGFSFAAQSVTIQVGVNATAQLTAIAATIPAGTSPSRCAVYARLQLPNGLPAVGVIGKAHLRSLPQKLSDVFVAGTAITATSAADGVISFDLPRGASCVITIPDHVPRCFVEVPDALSFELLGTATI